MNKSASQLAREWLAAKEAEESARERRYAIEHQICELLGVPESGAVAMSEGGLQITAIGRKVYLVDGPTWRRVAPTVPPQLQRVVRWNPELDRTGYFWCQENNPAAFAQITQAVRVRPAKPEIRVTPIEKPESD